MASVEKQQQQDPTDQKAGSASALEASQTTASRNLYEDIHAGRINNNNESVNDRTNDRESGLTEMPESVSELMMNEIRNSATETVDGVVKMLSKGISPATAEKFGALTLFDSNQAGMEATTEAKKKQGDGSTPNKTGEKPASGERTAPESGIGNMLSDLGNWASTAFNDYVTEPLNDYLNISDIFGSASEWNFSSSDLVPRSQIDSSVTSLNDTARQEFREALSSATRGIDLNGATDAGTNGLELPGDAYADGSVEIGGSMVTVMRTPGGDTFLKKGDEVIAQQRKDGSYNLSLKDGSKLDLKMTQGADGKYSLEKMERLKDDKLIQKLDDGVFYNYNYDAQGNKTSVDAAAHLKGPLSQEKLDKIRAELGDRGAAALKVHNEDGTDQRLLLQSHDSKTHSLTDVDKRNAQIFHDGKEYRLNAADQLALVGPDGQEEELKRDPDEARQRAEERLNEQLRTLAKQLGERARGERTDVDGVSVIKKDDGSFDITVTNPESGQKEARIVLPAGTNDDITVVKPDGETTKLKRDGGLTIQSNDEKPLVDFNPDKGLQTDKFNVDGKGLENLEDGSRIDPDGNFVDVDGNLISSGDEESEWWNQPACDDCQEQTENSSLSKATTSEVNTLGSISLSISRSGSPAAITVAKSIASEAFGVANAALSAMGNDLLNSIPIQLSLSIAQSAFNQAARSERTTTYASRAGISDATRLADLNRIGTLSSTSFSPEELVRDRMRAA